MQEWFEGVYGRWSHAAVLFILWLVPFHAVFTTWLGARFMHADFFRIWKEVILFVFCIIGLFLVVRSVRLRTWVFTSLTNRFMFAFCSYLLAMAAYGVVRGDVSPSAMVYGLIVDGRLFAGFILAVLAVHMGGSIRRWKFVLLAPLMLVVMFGILQATVLPRNFLGHFGYGPQTIPAIHLVDNKSEYQRFQSTLRGPNPLGAYLAALLPLLFVFCMKWWQRPAGRHAASVLTKLATVLVLLAAALVLFGTYSRSGWLGTALAFGIVLLCSVRLPRARWMIYMVVIALVIGGLTSVHILRNNDHFQNLIFHTSETSEATTSSNEQRFDGLSRGIRDVTNEPFGRGVGSAGPASIRNTDGPGRIAENFFIQIGQEAGIFGLALFLAAYGLVGWRLFARRRDPVGAALFGSFVGLTFINMVSHAWADDTLAYVWWMGVGIYLTEPPKRATLKHKRTSTKLSHAQSQDQTTIQSPRSASGPRQAKKPTASQARQAKRQKRQPAGRVAAVSNRRPKKR